MKKPILSLLALMAICSIESKAQFFEKTDYVGALSADAAKDWTKTWTNFTPNSTVYPATNDSTFAKTTVYTITSDMTLDASKVYLLKSTVSVESGATLTIPAGTIIRGEGDAANGFFAIIVVAQGGKIDIQGTVDKPVVMTSNADKDNRDRGDWGGLALFGNAINNQGQNIQMEGFNKITDYKSAGGGKYGGTNDEDNSGSIKYLRVEFAGFALDVNKEINAVTFGSIGKNTTVDFIQTSYSGDDSFEWFGGNVNAKHLIAFAGTDDDFDTDFGYSGNVQFGIAYRVPSLYDLSYTLSSGSSTSEGFESDNDANSSTLTPFTSAVFSNFTMVGPVKPGSKWSDLPSDQQAAFRRGARIRRNSKQSVMNTIFMGYRNFLMVDGTGSITNAGVDATPQTFENTLQFKNNYILNTANSYSSSSSTADGLVEVASNGPLANLNTWVKATENANIIDDVAYTEGTVLTKLALADLSMLDFKPVANSKVLTAANFGAKLLALDNSVFNNSTLDVYPNPTEGTVNVSFELLKNVNVSVEIFSLTGEKVATLANGELSAGVQILTSDLALNTGIYFVKVSSNSSTATVKLAVK